jgi:hypothetical protein
LPDIFSSGGTMNLYIDKYGRAKRVNGYVQQNLTPVLGTGGQPSRIRNLFHYKQTAGGSITRRLIGVFDDGFSEWSLRYSNDLGVTWTVLGAVGGTLVGAIADFAQFGDDLYITTGKSAPYKLKNITLGLAGATQSPTPSAYGSGIGGLLLGTYHYKVLSISGGIRQAGSVASNAVTAQDAKLNCSWATDPNTSVTGYELYRTTGTGDVYYFVDYIDGRTVSSVYQDNNADLTILENRILEEHGDPPPTAYFCEPHKQRMWYFKTDAFPTRGWFSDPGQPESVLTTANYLDFSDAETVGDECTGALGNFEGQIVVGTERALWTVGGTGQVIGNVIDWTRTRTNAQTGWVTSRAAARVPAGSKYTDQNGKAQVTNAVTCAYLTPLKDIRLFDGENDVIISHPMKTTLGTLSYAARRKSHALQDITRGEIAWFIATGASLEPTTAVVWNYRWGVWYERPLWGSMSAACEADSPTQASVLLAGEATISTGGYVYQLWVGNSANGANFRAQWMTKTLYGVTEQAQPAMSHQKRWRWCDFLFETDQNVTLTVEWLPGNTPDNAAGFGSTRIAPAAVTLVSADGDAIVSADSDLVAAAQSSTNARARLVNSAGRYLHDTGMRIRIFDNAQAGSWSLEAMNLAYQQLTGLQRRMQGAA